MAETINLTPEQQEAIAEIDRNLQIIACAGSGKTEVITRRIANILRSKPDVKPENIVAFTFTEKAAASMKKRIAKALDQDYLMDIDSMYIGTIHGFCYRLLNQYTEQFREHKVLDTVKNHLFVARYCGECGMQDLELEPYPRNVKLFLQCIDKMIDDYDHAATWTTEQREVLSKYRNCLYEHGYIDFSLMILETLRQIKENTDAKDYLSSIKYLVVDEYQDVNDLQEKLILRIAEAGANICVVGDDDQTIYQFRGSNAENMISFSERYANVHQVRLQKNFRCAPGIVDVADCVIGNNARRIKKKMISGVPDRLAEIIAEDYPGKAEQFEAIAERIAESHHAGIPYREMAVLVRKGKVIAPMSAALQRAGIPFETDSAEHFFSGDYFSRFVATLQILADVDKAKLYECWKDLTESAAFSAGFRFLRSSARNGHLRLGEIIHDFCEKIGFLDETAEDLDVRLTDLDGMIQILDDYDEIYRDWQISARIAGVLRFLATQAAEEYKYHSFKQRDSNADAVQIMTVHKAKGLEFHSVFLPEMNMREFPVSNMGGKQYWHVLGGVFEMQKEKYRSDLEDERKLFYVAITRAKQNLYMSYEWPDRPVSCFVKEAAGSRYLKVDRSTFGQHVKSVAEDADLWEYWETVKYARKQLCDYYGTACHFLPAAREDLARIRGMSPEELLSEASKNGLI